MSHEPSQYSCQHWTQRAGPFLGHLAGQLLGQVPQKAAENPKG